MKMKILLMALACAAGCWGQAPDVQMLHVQGNVYALFGGGGNTTVLMGKDGVLVVDTKSEAAAPKILEQIRTVSKGPILWVVNTHLHADHTAGNAALLKIGATDPQLAARVVAYESVLERMVNPPEGTAVRVSEAASINDTYSTPQKDVFLNGEAAVVYHLPNAHTDGDSIVFFRRSDVISTGDIFNPERYPIIDLANGGSINGVVAALNRILELTVPAKYQEGGTFVIPGHGRICDEADVVEYRDMVAIIRDRFADAIAKGMTLDQVKAAKLTRDYDTRYGATSGVWTTDQFVEAVYNSLKGAAR
jgi:glyoxylase-like metal-dependent hydrolase (beta-lactamase superfamily II)